MDLAFITGAACIAAYFATLLFALAAVSVRMYKSYRSLLQARNINARRRSRALRFGTLLLALATLAGISTWYYIIRFFAWTFFDQAGGNWQIWISQSDLFIQAYRMVSKTPQHWFWSSQLLVLTCGFVSVLKCAGTRRAWVFALLGFLGAISVASAIFLADWIARNAVDRNENEVSKETGRCQVGLVLGLSILLAFASIVANSLLDIIGPAYVFNLLFMHIILLVALIPEPRQTLVRPIPLSSWLKAISMCSLLYGFVQLLIIYKTSAQPGLSDIAQSLTNVIFENVCQTSITLDLFFLLGAVAVFGFYTHLDKYAERHVKNNFGSSP